MDHNINAGRKNPFISKVGETWKSCSASNITYKTAKFDQKLFKIIDNTMIQALFKKKISKNTNGVFVIQN